ncbi:unnamed protein product [Penicillium glandicola]
MTIPSETSQSSVKMAKGDEYSVRAKEILAKVPLIGERTRTRETNIEDLTPDISDGHNDFPYMIRGYHLNNTNDETFNPYEMPISHTDFNRLRIGHVGGQFWSAYVGCPPGNKSDDFSTATHHDSLRQTMQQIDLIHNLVAQYPKVLGFCQSVTDVWDVFRSGRIASMIGVEGLHQIGNSASVLRNFHRLGVRYVTLTHNSNNLYADSAAVADSERHPQLAPNPVHGGLSKDGRKMVAEMNRIGILQEAYVDRMIDLSHTSDAVQRHVLALSKSPVIFSHSSCAAITDHPRNVSTHVLDLLKDNGGLIMISFLPNLTDEDISKASVTEVADHIIYASQRIGWQHIGIGSDFDGMMHSVKGLEDVSRYPALIAELLRRGISDEVVCDIVGLNILRVWAKVETVARELQVDGAATLCDIIEPVWTQEIRNEVEKVRLGG